MEGLYAQHKLRDWLVKLFGLVEEDLVVHKKRLCFELFHVPPIAHVSKVGYQEFFRIETDPLEDFFINLEKPQE